VKASHAAEQEREGKARKTSLEHLNLEREEKIWGIREVNKNTINVRRRASNSMRRRPGFGKGE